MFAHDVVNRFRGRDMEKVPYDAFDEFYSSLIFELGIRKILHIPECQTLSFRSAYIYNWPNYYITCRDISGR